MNQNHIIIQPQQYGQQVVLPPRNVILPPRSNSVQISQRPISPGFVPPPRRFPPQQSGPSGIVPPRAALPPRGVSKTAVATNLPAYSAADNPPMYDALSLGHSSNEMSPTSPTKKLYIPSRTSSVTRVTPDDLMNQGQISFVKNNYDEAIQRWSQTLEGIASENDLFKEGKCLSNIGCALRVQGKHSEALDYFNIAFEKFSRYLVESKSRIGGLKNFIWIEIVLRTLEIDEVKYNFTNITNFYETRALNRSSSTKSAGSTTSSSTANSNGVFVGDPAFGPPIVVAFLNLVSNIGNINFSLGSFEEAIKWHENCLRLVDAVLEEFPLPVGFDPPAAKSNSEKSTTSEVPIKKNLKKLRSNDVKKLRLSYLHRETLLAQIRSFTHLGICLQSLGHDDEALFYQVRASSVLAFFSSQAPSSQSSRKSSLVSAVINHATQYEAVVSANHGTILHTLGDYSKSLELHERSAMKFIDIHDTYSLVKERGNLGCIWIDIGKSMNSVHWLHNLQKHLKLFPDTDRLINSPVIEKTEIFWGPPLIDGLNANLFEDLDINTTVSAGSKQIGKGIDILDNMLEKSKQVGDWMGIMNCCLNMAIGCTLTQQPFLALYYLSRTVHVLNENYELSIGSLSIPAYFEINIFSVLTQTLYLIVRMQATSDIQFFNSENVDSPQNPQTLNNILLALGIDTIDASNLNSDTLSYLITILIDKISVFQSINSPMTINLGIEKKSFNSLQKKKSISLLTLGKLQFLNGVSDKHPLNDTTPLDLKMEFVSKAEASFKQGSTLLQEVLRVGYHTEEELNESFLSSIKRLIEVEGESFVVNSQNNLTLVSSTVASFFELSLDLILISLNKRTSKFEPLQLLQFFQNNSRYVLAEDLTARTLNIYFEFLFKLYEHNLGLCSSCINEILNFGKNIEKVEVGGEEEFEEEEEVKVNEELVPVSANGVGLQYKDDPFGKGVICFPCAHFEKL
ncbi:hypothetical protein HDU92_004269 [Lobulomyces angularis]|nr:hypothetical protein HDU92_004269 [Lobulomyces angularis]